MFGHVLTLLEDIKETQRVHSRMLQSLLKQRDGPVAAGLPEDAFPLQMWQQTLADPVFLKEVVVVAETRGSAVDEATTRMMAFMETMDWSMSSGLLHYFFF
ncbi:unnamed protein product [Oreochromis niloticus]|nr:unnamed protein product [Mustela putorius furo]